MPLFIVPLMMMSVKKFLFYPIHHCDLVSADVLVYPRDGLVIKHYIANRKRKERARWQISNQMSAPGIALLYYHN